RRVERRLDIDRVGARRQVDFTGFPLDENRVTGDRTVETGDPLGLLHERGLAGRADAHDEAPARAEVTGRTIGAEPCHLGVRQLRPPLVLDHSGSATNTDGDGSATETILSLSATLTAPAGSGVPATAPDAPAPLSGSRLSVTVTSAPSPTSATAPITLPTATAEPPASLTAVPATRRSPEASPEVVTALSAAPMTTGAATMRALPAIVQFRPVASV